MILKSIDQNDRLLVQELILRIESAVSNAKDKLKNYELKQEHNRYIISVQVEGNELEADELGAIQALSSTHISKASVIIDNSKLYLRASVLRGSGYNKAKKVSDSTKPPTKPLTQPTARQEHCRNTDY